MLPSTLPHTKSFYNELDEVGVSYTPIHEHNRHVLDSQTLDSQQTTVNPGFPGANTGRWHAHLCIPSWHPVGRSTQWRYRPEQACSLRSYSLCQRECSGSKWSCPPPCHVPHCLPVNTHMHSDPQDQLIGWLMPGIIPLPPVWKMTTCAFQDGLALSS